MRRRLKEVWVLQSADAESGVRDSGARCCSIQWLGFWICLGFVQGIGARFQVFPRCYHLKNHIFCPPMPQKKPFWGLKRCLLHVACRAPYPIFRLLESQFCVLHSLRPSYQLFESCQHKKNHKGLSYKEVLIGNLVVHVTFIEYH